MTDCTLQLLSSQYKRQAKHIKGQLRLCPPSAGLTTLAKLIHANQVSNTSQELCLLWPILPQLTKPTECYFVADYTVSIKQAKKVAARFGGIAKEAVSVGGEPKQFTSTWDSMATKKQALHESV